MARDMHAWIDAQLAAPRKKALPVLSFPGVQLMGITVAQLIGDAERQAECMVRVADRCDAAASVSFMDLSLEAEAFGAPIQVSDDEVPTVVGAIVKTEADARALRPPAPRAARTGLYIDAIGHAARRIADRPVLAGVIGPFSLAGRLMDMTEIMILSLEEPDMVHAVLDVAADFLIGHILAYREAGADGFVLAEPAAGLLSPALHAEFSTPYVRRILDAAQTPTFAAVYHNCGQTPPLLDSILENGARMLHFGNAVSMPDIAARIPADKLVLGNLDPAGAFRLGTPESVYADATAMLRSCAGFSNYMPSSGCDIPPLAPWANIDAFFKAVADFDA